MRKKFRHTDLHPTARCKHCGRSIKARLVAIKRREPEECYMHYALRRCREMGRAVPARLAALARKRGAQHV